MRTIVGQEDLPLNFFSASEVPADGLKKKDYLENTENGTVDVDSLTTSLAGTPEGEGWRLFKPRIGDDGSSYDGLRQLLKLNREDAVRELDRLTKTNPVHPHSLRLKVAAAVLRDLILIGWEFHVNSHWVYVRPSESSTREERKQNIRQVLLFGRNDQLSEETHRRFLFSLERPSKYSSAKPVTDLIVDGRRLAAQIELVKAMPVEEQRDALKRVCQPYLQLVSEERDQFTNIRLMDIWRYFRHSWSSRYRSSPGRNLFYLVRDAAQPNHPVMAIAALGNTVMQLTVRDTCLGWTVPGLLQLIQKGEVTDTELLAAFRHRLEEDYSQIYLDDLPVDPRIDHSVDEETLGRLVVIEEKSRQERTGALKNNDAGATPKRAEQFSLEQLLELTKTPLYKSKRARATREILKAYRTIASWTGGVADLVASPEGEWAVGTCIKQLKKRYSATSMMELTVCGAVPPYNHLLGGKLICLMMMSPRVVQDYRERYKDVVSIIASQMAGRPITKDPALVFLGTTSLYSDSSSQYNRVRLPRGAVSGQSAEIVYERMGVTGGFGSGNFSVETERGLAALAEEHKTYRNVNFVYGEGQSPKLRQLREGFAALGLDQANLQQHGAPRIIYGVSLVKNHQRVLLGIDLAPQYALDPTSDTAEADIADFWIQRWLRSRINYAPALEALKNSTPLRERVSRLIPTPPELTGHPNLSTAEPGTPMTTMDLKAQDRLDFIRLLYRNESAFSDHVAIARLKELNIRTKLDEVVRKIVRSGGSVVITGNAGDGKTHAILLMKNDLKDAEVITDASEFSAKDIAERWQRARDANKPFCIAINEGPLMDLIRGYRKDYPWLQDIHANLLKRVGYRPLDSVTSEEEESWKPKEGETFIIDLSLRRVLSPDLTKAIIEKLTDERWFEACTSCPALEACGVTYNRRMLRSDLPQNRMIKLLTTIGERGARATFREALAFVSYLIFGGRRCGELREFGKAESVRYYWNAFEGEGEIFEQLSQGLDPLKQTYAKVDEHLWRGIFRSEDFVGHAQLPILQRNLDEVSDKEPETLRDDFTCLKRRWYFEHPLGKLFVFTDAEKLFAELQDTQIAIQIRLSRLISLINRWWNKGDAGKSDALRLWTKLTYSPRPRNQAMVSGLSVQRLKLGLYKPVLAPALRRAFGEQPISYLLLAPVDAPRFASLLVDPPLLHALISGSVSEDNDEVIRKLNQFNETLCRHGENSPDVRTIEVLDPHSELHTTVVVDLASFRYDSAT